LANAALAVTDRNLTKFRIVSHRTSGQSLDYPWLRVKQICKILWKSLLTFQSVGL